MTRTRSILLGRPHVRRLRMTGVAVAVVALLLLGAVSPAGAIGEPDTTFSGDGRQTTNLTPSFDIGFAAAVQEDGKILAAGGAGGRMFLTRYNPDGTLDTSFSGDGRAFVDFGPNDDAAYDIAIDDNGAIVLVGAGAELYAHGPGSVHRGRRARHHLQR